MALFNEDTGVRLDPETDDPRLTAPKPVVNAPQPQQDLLPDKGETVPQKQPSHNQGGKR